MKKSTAYIHIPFSILGALARQGYISLEVVAQNSKKGQFVQQNNTAPTNQGKMHTFIQRNTRFPSSGKFISKLHSSSSSSLVA